MSLRKVYVYLSVYLYLSSSSSRELILKQTNKQKHTQHDTYFRACV